MKVTENYMLQQMQAMATAMNGVPQTGSKDKTAEGGSFQEMMEQAGKNTSEKAPAKETGSREPVKDEAAEGEKLPVKTQEKEELKPEELAANPNAVNLLALFRPEVVQTAEEETVIEMPVEAIAQESIEGPELALDGQMSAMDANVESGVDTESPMEQQTGGFQQAVDNVPQEQQAETTETVEAPETPVEQTETVERPQREEPQTEIQVETDEEPKAEAADVEQPVFHETENTPVKVGERYETVDTQKPDMEAKLADTIQTAAQSGAERVEIHLAPQNLGSLVIEMTKDVNGALQVVLHASNARAANVLSQHMDGLHAALRAYSQEEVRVEVQRSDESQQQNFRQADPDGRGQQQRRQQQERHEEQHTGSQEFLQKLRLGLDA